MHAPITIKLANKKSSSKIAGPNLIKMRERQDSALSIRRVVFCALKNRIAYSKRE